MHSYPIIKLLFVSGHPVEVHQRGRHHREGEHLEVGDRRQKSGLDQRVDPGLRGDVADVNSKKRSVVMTVVNVINIEWSHNT